MMRVGEQDLRWFRLDDESAIGSARRFATATSHGLGFSNERAAEVAIAVTELATNAHRHGRGGSMLVRLGPVEAPASGAPADIDLEVLVIDAGPGLDLDTALRDGYSTAGTLGVGLGAVRRLANRFEVHSQAERGTVILAVFARDASAALVPAVIDGITRPITGEEVCGDAWAFRRDGSRTSLLLADGLGHGLLAARASKVAVDCFLASEWSGPRALLEDAHRRMGGERGAAVLAIDLDVAAGTLRFAGVGNVVGRVVGVTKPAHLLSQPGIVGHHMRRVQETEIALEPGAVLVVHSDGLTPKWDVTMLRGLLGCSTTVLGAVLLREAGLRQDDATVVVMRTPA